MEFTNAFTANASMDQVWSILTNVEEVAPCVPGAQITELIDEHHFKGVVKVKLGAVSVSYKGEMDMQPDEAERTIVLQGKGTEARGSGGATGKITVRLAPAGAEHTEVNIHSEVDVTGRVATFGRGIMQDVANRLIKEFASCIQRKLEAGGTEASASAEGSPAGTSSSPDVTAPAQSESTPTDQTEVPGSAAGRMVAAQGGSSHPPAPSSGATEMNLTGLLADVLRSRLAGSLRALATWIEPR